MLLLDGKPFLILGKSKTAPDGGSQTFRAGVNGRGLSRVSVKQGDFLHFIVDANRDYYHDSTGMTVTITRVSATASTPAQTSHTATDK